MSTRTYVADTTRSPHARLHPVPISAVQLSDTFIEPRRQLNRSVTIPTQYDHLETTNRLRNFRRVVQNTKDVPFDGIYFNDSDVYKWLEAAASALADPALENRAQLEEQIATVTELIEGAQQPNGYLNTYFMWEREGERYKNLGDMHELYCMGHFLQAAVAHYRATGSDRLLNVARRVADHLDETFGPAESGKREGACGHEEIEMALVELFRATGEPRYRNLAQYFVDARGKEPTAVYGGHGDRSYRQDHVPYRELKEVIGHAVRMLYLTTAAADLVLETGESALLDANIAQWRNMTEQRIYLSGGIGSRWEGEAFGKDYELPADRAYTETCAAIASVMWNHRLFLLTGDVQYADLLEHTFYNAVLPGLSFSGDEYYYQNPLENDGTHRRQKWFGCACCPPNVARLLAQLPGYFYATDTTNSIFAALYADGTATITLPEAGEVTLTTRTGYPFDGGITITVEKASAPFTLNLRVPIWADGATLTLPDSETISALPGTFIPVSLSGAVGESVLLNLPLAVRQVEGHPFVGDTGGRVAVLRGPLLYCAEAADNPDIDIRELALSQTDDLAPIIHPGFANVTALKGTASIRLVENPAALYRPRTESKPTGQPVPVTLIPYYAWANREAGAMRVWLQKA